MTTPVLLSWLWKPHNAWRAETGYGPKHIIWLERQLRYAKSRLRHVCVCEDADDWRAQLERAGIETYPLWSWPRGPKEQYGSDCYVRMGLWGEPGALLSERLGVSEAVWTDCDVIWREGGDAAVTAGAGPRYWLPRSVHESLVVSGVFGRNRELWHGLNGSVVRLDLGSRPDWWAAVHDRDWCAETESRIVGSDQAALTRLVLEDMGEDWREPNRRIFDAPVFNNRAIAVWGWPGRAAIVYFPFDRDVMKPWNARDVHVRSEFQRRAGMEGSPRRGEAVLRRLGR